MPDSWTTTRFPWQEIRLLQIAPLMAYRGEVSQGAGPVTVTHPFYTWWWMLEGEVKLTVAGGERRIGSGFWVLIPAGMRRVQHFRKGSRILSINFQCGWAAGVPALEIPRLLVAPAEALPPLRPLAEAICEATGKEGGHRSLAAYEPSLPEGLRFRADLIRFAELLLGYAARHGGGRLPPRRQGDRRLETVLHTLHEAPRAGPLPYERWQRQTGLGRSQLERLARSRLGVSLPAYRDRLLVTEACRVLAEEPLLIKEVAAAFGFVDSAHFCRWIRRKTGHSPQELRRLSP